MVVVAGEVFGQLPPGELVGTDDAMDDPGILEHHQVAVDGALGEIRMFVEDLGDGERPGRGGEHAQQHLAVRGESLADVAQTGGDGLAHFADRGIERRVASGRA